MAIWSICSYVVQNRDKIVTNDLLHLFATENHDICRKHCAQTYYISPSYFLLVLSVLSSEIMVPANVGSI